MDGEGGATLAEKRRRLKEGVAHHQAGRLREAEAVYRGILDLDPQYPDAHHLLGVIAYQRGNYDEAERRIRRAIETGGDNHIFYSNLGNALFEAGRLADGLEAYDTAVRLKPDFAMGHYNRGNVLKEQGELDAAVAAYQEAIRLQPDYAEAYNNMGNTLKDLVRVEETLDCYRRALEIRPGYARAHTNMLLTLHYLPDVSPSELKAEHDRYEAHHARPLASRIRPHGNPPDPEKRLRVGFVSADFCRHPVSYFLLPYLMAHDPSAVEIFCYDQREQSDAVTETLKEKADAWRVIQRMSDEAAAERIRADGIDILVDLSGHTARNRLLVFARKPAPVQATWLGYPDTTGMSAMDYLICDRWVAPPGAEGWFSETLLRLPGGYLCYAPLECAPDVGPLPAREAGHLTFGCLNNLPKVTTATINVWAELLRAIPDARLILKSRPLEYESVRRRYRDLLEGAGISADRVEMIGYTPSTADHLAIYNRIDIALDPLGYNGTTTTCEALYMGVPVVSLAGPNFAARQGVSILSAAGLTDWIAESETDYLNKALRWERNLDDLADLRRSLRQRMIRSPLCNGKRLARELETAFREIWRTWCGGRKAAVPAGKRRRKVLHVGCGPAGRLHPTFAGKNWEEVRLDIDPAARPDITASITDMAPVADGSVDAVYSAHNLEHLTADEVPVALREFFRVIRPDGFVLVTVPDLAAIAPFIAGDRLDEVLYTSPAGPITPLDVLYGFGPALAQGKTQMAHRTGFTAETLEAAFRTAGFPGVDVETEPKQFALVALARKQADVGPRLSKATPPPAPTPDLDGKLAEAMAHQKAGRHAEAQKIYKAILADHPDHPDALHLYGLTRHQLGDHETARKSIERAIRLKPDAAFFHVNLGNVQMAAGDLDGAVKTYRRALSLKPESVSAQVNLASVLRRRGRMAEAAEAYQAALKLQPDRASLHHSLGDVLRDLGRQSGAIKCYQKALSIKPDYPEVYNNLGNVYKDLRRFGRAVAAYRKALEIRPDHPDVHTNLGSALKDRGDSAGAVAAYERALTLKPECHMARTNLLLSMLYDPAQDVDALYAAHRRWNDFHGRPVAGRPAYSNSPDPDRRLRVGYVSPDFRHHSCAWFIEPLLAHHDPDAVEVHCYAEVIREDAITERIRGHAEGWFRTVGLSDAAVARRVMEDGIDILVDLAGHTSYNRLRVFAEAPAPVQISWLGYGTTTGLDVMDYKLSDPWITPPDIAERFSETLWRLNRCFLAYRPETTPDAETVSPFEKNGYITFASFNNMSKIQPVTLEYWAELLKSVPDSRLLIKAKQSRDDYSTRRVRDGLAAFGVDPDRLVFQPYAAKAADHLATYALADICIDTFPYNGCTTTCEALWMGVPVVSPAGDRTVARYGATLLPAAALPDLVAETPADFVRIAAGLAEDTDRLRRLRRTMRDRLLASALCDAAGFARAVEGAYREIWRRWCEGSNRS